MKVKSKIESKSKTSRQLNQFENFKEFAQKLFRVPKKEIDEQEKIYKAQKEKEKAKS